METNYAKPYSMPGARAGPVLVRYLPAPPEPVWLPASTAPALLRPFEQQASLVDKIFEAAPVDQPDPADFAGERAATQKEQAHLLLEQLAARHAVSEEIRREIMEEECRVQSKLRPFTYMPDGLGYQSKFAIELVKELQALRREARAEAVACWRDTGRILSELCERWTEYADQSHRARLMDLGV